MNSVLGELHAVALPVVFVRFSTPGGHTVIREMSKGVEGDVFPAVFPDSVQLLFLVTICKIRTFPVGLIYFVGLAQ